MGLTQAILTAVVLSLTLSACGGGSAEPDSSTVASMPTQETAVSNGSADNTPAPQEQAVSEEQQVVSVVTPPAPAPTPVKPVTPTTPAVKPVVTTTPPKDTNDTGGVQSPIDPVESVAEQPVNQIPEISGNPTSVVDAGQVYSFSPTATDADADTLTFSAINLPYWADFNTQDGTVSGSPTDQDIGDFNNIRISVSDGTDSAELAAFSISVNPVVVAQTTGSISLRWIAPATRTDGTPLNLGDINGYYIYVGTTRDNLQMWTELTDGDMTTLTIDDLEFGDYYVAISVFDREANVSAQSNVVMKSVIN